VKVKQVSQGEWFVKARVDLKHKDKHINGNWPSSSLWYIEFKNIINQNFNYMKFFEFATTIFKTTCLKQVQNIFIKIKQMSQPTKYIRIQAQVD
jgi:hypothetical protein